MFNGSHKDNSTLGLTMLNKRFRERLSWPPRVSLYQPMNTNLVGRALGLACPNPNPNPKSLTKSQPLNLILILRNPDLYIEHPHNRYTLLQCWSKIKKSVKNLTLLLNSTAIHKMDKLQLQSDSSSMSTLYHCMKL